MGARRNLISGLGSLDFSHGGRRDLEAPFSILWKHGFVFREGTTHKPSPKVLVLRPQTVAGSPLSCMASDTTATPAAAECGLFKT